MYNQVLPTLMLVLVVVIFAVQIAFSRFWLAQYRFGPMEWLWRLLTYGRWQELQRRNDLQNQQ